MKQKTKHTIIMWIADIVGGMIGGIIVTMWLGVVFYYGLQLGVK